MELAKSDVEEELTRVLHLARETETEAREVRRWLEEAVAVAAGRARPCGYCSKAIAGRRDRVYCSTNCRLKAHHHRRAHAESLPDDGPNDTA